MTYYRVPTRMDGYICRKGKKDTGYELITDELLTKRECAKIGAPLEKLEMVFIAKSNVHRSFGVRFQNIIM